MNDHDELERLQAEVARLEAALEAVRRQADQWRQVAEERRVTLERFRQHPLVRPMFWLARFVLPVVHRLRRKMGHVERLVRRPRRAASSLRAFPARMAAPLRQRLLEASIDRLPGAPRTSVRVSVIVLTHDGIERLLTLLPALRRTLDPARTEVIVVDNGSGEATRRFLAHQDDVHVVRLEENRSFSEANNAGAAAAGGDVLCFLNDDVQPLAEGWLDHMVAEIGGEVAAVGAQLVYPRRSLLGGGARDLTVQHAGIELQPVPGDVPRAVNIGGRSPKPDAPVTEVAAATAACLAVARSRFEQVGGFDARYVYGAEDVDLCWRLRRAGGRVVVAPAAVLYHHEGATRHREDRGVLQARQARNWSRLADRFGPELSRAVEMDRLEGRLALTRTPYRVAITITRDLSSGGYGDLHTAHALGEALAALGWEVRYVERYRDAWYRLPDDVDAVIVLLDTYDIRRIARPGLTTIAWVRNWADRWLAHPWFDQYDVVLAASGRVAHLVEASTGRQPALFPLATDPDRFAPGPDRDGSVILPVNNWGDDRGVAALLQRSPDVQLFGKGWERVPAVAGNWRGHLPHEQIAELYGRCLVVVDQAGEHTRTDASVNSRVFDALAAGAMVVSDQVEGVRELFGERVPTYGDANDLHAVLEVLVADPSRTRGRAEELRDLVLAGHTYMARAHRLRELLIDRVERASFVLRVSAPNRRVAPTWGDWHLAEGLARALRRSGHRVRLQTADEWEDLDGRTSDVAVHLKGRSRAPKFGGQVHVIWNISHPEELTDEECDAADLVLVAAPRFTEELRTRTSTPVEVLLQATDERRFHPRRVDARYRHPVAFIGNSRHVMRPVVRDAMAAGLDVAIYGANWDRFVEPHHVRARFVPNEELPVVYSSVHVLLNDHWEGMRQWGFVSNRLYDALACGSCVVSDDVEELREQFGDAVAVYREPEELRPLVTRLLTDEAERRRMGEEGRERVLAGHTFTHRARQLLDAVEPLVRARRQVTEESTG